MISRFKIKRAAASGLIVAALALPAFTLPALGQSAAQEQSGRVLSLPNVQIPVIVFDRERVQKQSNVGQAMSAQLEVLQQALLDENATIFADLEAEEKELSNLKLGLPEDEFRARATAFDGKVVRIRAEQAEKAKDVEAQYEASLRAFELNLNTVLTDIARTVGAVAVFERKQLYLMSGSIDVSQQVIAQIDGQTPPSLGPTQN